MRWAAGTCRRDGIDIRYVRTGGAKPPVVMLHGLTGNGACWTPLARSLQGDHDVVMPDARGHGDSSAPLHGYRYEDHARDVIGLISALGLCGPTLVGHSMGGMTAALVASQASIRLRGVALLDPAFLTPERQREVRDGDAAEQHRLLLMRDERDVAAQLESRHPQRSREIVRLLAHARLQTRTAAFDVLTPPHPDYHRLMEAIDVPVLLVLGDEGVVSLETARELQAADPRVRVDLIRHAGHGVQYDQPAQVAAVLASFLRSLVASAPGA